MYIYICLYIYIYIHRRYIALQYSDMICENQLIDGIKAIINHVDNQHTYCDRSRNDRREAVSVKEHWITFWNNQTRPLVGCIPRFIFHVDLCRLKVYAEKCYHSVPFLVLYWTYQESLMKISSTAILDCALANFSLYNDHIDDDSDDNND